MAAKKPAPEVNDESLDNDQAEAGNPAGEQGEAAPRAEAGREGAERSGQAEKLVTMVEVENLTHSLIFQHSTGIKIAPKAVATVRADGWLQNQLAAGLLKRV